MGVTTGFLQFGEVEWQFRGRWPAGSRERSHLANEVGAGMDVCLYLLLEFQSGVDRFMAVRIMAYVALLYQDLIRQGQLTVKGKLPPVLPMVLYNGERQWTTAAQDVADLVGIVPGGLERYCPALRYLLLDEIRLSQTELGPLRNLAAALFQLERSREPSDVRRILGSLVEWLRSPEQIGLRRAFAVWFNRVFLPARLPGQEFPEAQDLQEVRAMLEERVKEWTKSWKEQGLQQGRQEGELNLLRRLLQRRFGTLPKWVEEKLVQADSPSLELWADQVLNAKSLQGVFDK